MEGPGYQVSGYTFHGDWDKYALPPKIRHGSMIAISRKEYNAIIAAFPNSEKQEDSPRSGTPCGHFGVSFRIVPGLLRTT